MSHQPAVSDVLAAYGWDDRVAARFTMLDVPDHVPGRVARVDRGSCLVATADGLVRASPYTLASRRAGLDLVPATGDWVTLADDPHEGAAIVGVVPRWSAISRKDPDEGVTVEQVLAANVDVFAVVCALDRSLVQNRVERMLSVAWESGALPVVVLTKADLAEDLAVVVREAQAVAGAGVSVHVTSAMSGEGLDEIRALLQPTRTLAVIGPSGAGKSTLVNGIAGTDMQSTGPVREADGRGRHTTTTRDLVPVPTGACSSTPPACAAFRSGTASRGSRTRSPTSRTWPRAAASVTAATSRSPGARYGRRWHRARSSLVAWRATTSCTTSSRPSSSARTSVPAGQLAAALAG